MNVLYFFESIRNPVCDFFFSAVTHIGGETVFLVVAILFLWCIDKREGYFILISCFVGALINQTLKLLFRIPRPWVRDPNFTIVEAAREGATGYSFPSGHTQNAVGLFGAIGATRPTKRKTWICAAFIFVVALSRLYLGAHTPLDVGVSLLIGVPLVLVLAPVFSDRRRFDRSLPWFCFVSYRLTVLYLIYVFYSVGTDVDADNLASAREVAATFHGCAAGILVVYYLDRRFLHFETGAPWYGQCFKILLGLGGVLLLKVGLSAPLLALFGGHDGIARSVRYFIVVLFAGGIWPLSFRFWSSLRIPFLDRLFPSKKP